MKWQESHSQLWTVCTPYNYFFLFGDRQKEVENVSDVCLKFFYWYRSKFFFFGKMSAVRSQDPTMDTQSWSSARRWWARVCPSASTLTTNSDSTFTFSLGTRETMEKKDSVVAPETMEDEPTADWLARTPTQSLSLSSSRNYTVKRRFPSSLTLIFRIKLISINGEGVGGTLMQEVH